MDMSGGPDERPHYVRARIIGGVGLFLLAGILMVADAFNAEYTVDSIQLGLLLGTASLLLGVEGIRRVIGGGG